jgi:hypothetical protein
MCQVNSSLSNEVDEDHPCQVKYNNHSNIVNYGDFIFSDIHSFLHELE